MKKRSLCFTFSQKRHNTPHGGGGGGGGVVVFVTSTAPSSCGISPQAGEGGGGVECWRVVMQLCPLWAAGQPLATEASEAMPMTAEWRAHRPAGRRRPHPFP